VRIRDISKSTGFLLLRLLFGRLSLASLMPLLLHMNLGLFASELSLAFLFASLFFFTSELSLFLFASESSLFLLASKLSLTFLFASTSS
jgi:hypothetical protein